MLVSRSQTNKIRSLFLFVFDDDLLICSLISRAVVEPRYRISTLRSREITKYSNFQTTMTSSILLWRRTQGSGSLLTICLCPQRPQHPFQPTLISYHQIQLWDLTTLSRRRMSSTLLEPRWLVLLRVNPRWLLLVPQLGKKGRKKTNHCLMPFPPLILKNLCAKKNHTGLDEAPRSRRQTCNRLQHNT